MNYSQASALIERLNRRMRPLPWYQWAVEITWDKLLHWTKVLKLEGKDE